MILMRQIVRVEKKQDRLSALKEIHLKFNDIGK
jgi:hypothetical protein